MAWISQSHKAGLMSHYPRCSAWILLTTCDVQVQSMGHHPVSSPLLMTNIQLTLSSSNSQLWLSLYYPGVSGFPAPSLPHNYFQSSFHLVIALGFYPGSRFFFTGCQNLNTQLSEQQNNAHRKITHAGYLKCYMSLSFPKKKLELFGFCSSKHFQQQIYLLD